MPRARAISSRRSGSPLRPCGIRAETLGDRFVIEWLFDGGGPVGPEPVFLTLHRDGRAQAVWPAQRFLTGDVTFGYEGPAGAAGTTYWRDGSEVEPDFPSPSSGRSACLVPPTHLDCSSPFTLTCGGSVAVDLPVAAPAQAETYACALNTYPANERTGRLDIGIPRRVVVTVDLPDADLLHVTGPPDCSEAECLAVSDDTLSFPVLFAGDHWFVVDKTTAGAGGARVDVTCEALPELTCGGMLSGTTLGGVDAVAERACVPVTLDGLESHALVTTLTTGHLAITLDGTPAGLWVVVKDDTGACLAAGEGGATVFEAPAGTYVVTVDGAAGASGDFTLLLECGTRLDCSSAVVAPCGTTIVGDTTSAPTQRTGIYSCDATVNDGAEDVWLLRNPREQLVTARFTSRQPGQEAYLLGSCDEGDCIFGRLQGACALLPAGDHWLVVDGPQGSEGAYELELDCRRIATPGVELAAVSLDTSGMPTDCRTLGVSGSVGVVVANQGSDPAPPPFDVVAFLDDGSGAYDVGLDTLLGTATVSAPIPPGESVRVDVPVVGALPFRDGFVHGQVDPGRVVADVDRGNDVTSTGASCLVGEHPVEPVALQLEWEWTSSLDAPSFLDVESVPLVGDIDGDGYPEVLAGGEECCGGPATGVIWRALDGRTGSERQVASDPAFRLTSSSAPALVRFGGDAAATLVGQSFQDPARLVAFELAPGGRTWLSDVLPVRDPFDTWGGAAVAADIDGDGTAEIAWGPNVVDATGALFWTPEPGGTLGAADGGPLSVVIDLDGDGLQEVIAGPTAYELDAMTRTGVIRWTNPAVPDGYAAVGELDGDPGPEIAIAEHGRLHVLDGEDGALRWTRQVPQGGGGPCSGISGCGAALRRSSTRTGTGVPRWVSWEGTGSSSSAGTVRSHGRRPSSSARQGSRRRRPST